MEKADYNQNKILPESLKTLLKDVRQQDRQTLEKRLFEARAANSISEELSSSPNMEKGFIILTDRIADLLSVEIVSLMLMDTKTGNLTIKCAKGLNEEAIRDVKVKSGEGVSGWVAQTGQHVLIKDIRNDPRFSARKGSRYSTNSLLSVPLKFGNKVIGVINVNNKVSKDIFTEEELSALETVSSAVSACIENIRLYNEIKSVDKLKSDAIANVSHELRTPLAAIKESIALIADGTTGGSLNDGQKRFLELAGANITRLERMIDDMLDLAKLDSRTIAMKRKLFSVSGLLDITVDSLKPMALAKEINLTSQLPEKKIEIWGDEDKLAEVVMNLIENAIKYNKPQGKITVGLEEMSEAVKIYVADTGPGIPACDREHIFDRFYQVERNAQKQGKGVGLGLAIVKEIIQMHGGEIWVESEVDKGSTFMITLPKNLRGSR